MTPAIAAAALSDAVGWLPSGPVPAETDADAFRSALAALFAMAGTVSPPAISIGSDAYGSAGSVEVTESPKFAGGMAAGDDMTGLVADLEGEPANDESFELATKIEPAPAPSATAVTQILGRFEALTIQIGAPEPNDEDRKQQPVSSPAVPAPQFVPTPPSFEFEARESGGDRAVATQPATPPETSAAPAPGEVAFEAVITEAPVEGGPEAAGPAKADPSAKGAAFQPDAQAHERTRDGSQQISLDPDLRQGRKRPPEAPQDIRSTAPGIGQKSEIATQQDRRAPAAPSLAAQRAAHIERASETRSEPVAVRHLRLQVVPDPARPVQVLIAEKRGAVHLSVRAGDAETSSVLRGDLQRLVADLERSGLRAETFAPTQAGGDEPTRAVDAALFARSEPDFGEGQRRWQQRDSRPRSRKQDGEDEEVAFSLDYASEKAQ